MSRAAPGVSVLQRVLERWSQLNSHKEEVVEDTRQAPHMPWCQDPKDHTYTTTVEDFIGHTTQQALLQASQMPS